MNTLDIIFLALIGASIIYSLIRGLVREIFSFLSIILGFFAASYAWATGPSVCWARYFPDW